MWGSQRDHVCSTTLPTLTPMTLIHYDWQITDDKASWRPSFFPNPVATMDTQQPPHRLPKIKFRVLIIGRANAGKTSILQRVCDTTESPVIYRRKGLRKERVRCLSFVNFASLVSPPDQIQFDPSIEVGDIVPFIGYDWHLSQRGEHRIEDEIVFSNHDNYIFHDSCGFESGGEEELGIVQNFVRNKSREKLLASRLHAIWFGVLSVTTIATTEGHIWRYCIPMDNQRPELDLKHFKDICPDQNGASVWSSVIEVNSWFWSSCYCGVHKVWPVQAGHRDGFGGWRSRRAGYRTWDTVSEELPLPPWCWS